MAEEVMLKKEKNGNIKIKSGYVGFSWTVLFFGCFVPLFRGDFLAALVMLVGGAIIGGLTAGTGILIVELVLAFAYNKYYTKNLINQGYQPANEESKMLLDENDIDY